MSGRSPSSPSPAPRAALVLRGALVGALALAAIACSNLSLSTSDSMGGPAPSGSQNDLDASATADGGTGASPGSDATGVGDAAAPSVVGNALCNYGYTTDASHACRPDDSSSCTQPSDAGVVEDGGDAAPPLAACHVVHGAGRTTQACTAAGPGGNGDQCQTGADCQESFECVGSPGQCRHYCCGGEAACDALGWKSFCDVQPVASGASGDLDASAASPSYRVPVCMPVSECTLLGNDCTAGATTCAVVKDDGTTTCVDVGTAGVGESCDTEHCQAGLNCLGSGTSGRICYQLCRVADSPSACPAMQTCISSAQIFKNPAYGICQ